MAVRLLRRGPGPAPSTTDPRFVSHSARKLYEHALDAIVSMWTRVRDRWMLAELLQAAFIPAAAVESIADHLDRDPVIAPRFEVVHQSTDPGIAITVHGERARVASLENPFAALRLSANTMPTFSWTFSG
ncbi:MAG: CoA transferase [Anaerolineaceae bacterium]